jgi:membrane protein DedA with SNARE-associated domain
LAVEVELSLHLGHLLLVRLEVGLHLVFFELEDLVLLPLALARVVGGEAVALDTLDAALLLLVLGLGSLAGRQVSLGLGEHLPPRLALLDRLALGGRRRRGL